MRLMTPLVMAFVALAGCGREPEPAARREHFNVAVDTEGKITLNGEQVTEVELSAYLDSRSGTLIFEKHADGAWTVTVDGKPMTLGEYQAYLASKSDGKRGARP